MVLHIYEPKRDPAGFPMQIFKSDTFETIAYPRKQKTLKITRIIRVLGLAYLVGPGGVDLIGVKRLYSADLSDILRETWIWYNSQRLRVILWDLDGLSRIF